jgi:hypothetical protein
MPFVEAGDMNHLQLAVFGIGQRQIIQKFCEHRTLRRLRAGPARQRCVVCTASTNTSIVTLRAAPRNTRLVFL